MPSPTSKRTNDLIVAPFDLTKAPTVVSGSFTKACPESVTSLINFFIRPPIIFSMMLSGLPDSLACSTKIAFSLSRISAALRKKKKILPMR
jgi:hypothetical protein